MNSYNFKITFEDLKNIKNTLFHSYDEFFINYINSFKGKNVLEKFKNILKVWANDVSPTLNLNLNDKPTKIQFAYVVSQMNLEVSNFTISNDKCEVVIGIPNEFEIVDGLVPVYDVIKTIKMCGMVMNFDDLVFLEKKKIIDNLPANIFNLIMVEILKREDFTVLFDNPSLNTLKINFLTNEPYMFLKGLFENYDELYFRDVIFHLSKRLDGNILMKSTPDELDYYIGKFSKETDQQSQVMGIE